MVDFLGNSLSGAFSMGVFKKRSSPDQKVIE